MLSVAVFSDKPNVIMLSVTYFIHILSLIFIATLNVVMLSIAFSHFYCYADHHKFLYAESHFNRNADHRHTECQIFIVMPRVSFS
jgi:hypothetical protein